jgi:hypothetical protein
MVLSLGMLVVFAGCLWSQQAPAVKVVPANMPKLGTVDPRYVSYNVEMVEVTGGRFWSPYKSSVQGQPAPQPNQEVGGMSSLYQYRPPIDLSNARLRKLASALGPAYMRVSGTWQNSTYFQNDDDPPLKEPPAGFKSVLTRAAWKRVVDFSNAVGAKIVTSAAISAGTRDAQGVWTPAQAHEVFDYTKSLGSSIAAIEFMNEPSFPQQGGAPKGYDAEAFARDMKVFSAFLRKESPNTIFLGPGSTGEGVSLAPPGVKLKVLETEDLMKATGPVFDAFSYHFYGTISKRCTGIMKIDQALSAEWLDRTNISEAFYGSLRDRYLAGKPLWLTETAQAACGGDKFAGQYADSFRFLNQLGSLAQKGVKVVMHNTLVASDYGLLNEETYEPKPNYWAAMLWNRTMGTVVLDPGLAKDESLRIYAHCMKGTKGGVALLALNTDTKSARTLSIPVSAERYTLTATDLGSENVLLNGSALQAEKDGSLPLIKGKRVEAGALELAPQSITFLAMPSARNASCK